MYTKTIYNLGGGGEICLEKMNTFVYCIQYIYDCTYQIYVRQMSVFLFFLLCSTNISAVSRSVRFSYCLYLRVRSSTTKIIKKKTSRKIIYLFTLRLYILWLRLRVCFARNFQFVNILCLVQWHTKRHSPKQMRESHY